MFEALAARTLALRMVCRAGSGIGWSRKFPWMVRKRSMVLIVSLAGEAGPSVALASAPAARAVLASAPSNKSPPPSTALCLRNVRRLDFVFMGLFSKRLAGDELRELLLGRLGCPTTFRSR